MKSSRDTLIRLIAVFKLVKVVLLIATGVGILKLIHKDIAGELDHWIAMLGLDPGSRYVSQGIQKVTSLSPAKIKELGLASFLYAALFLTEGIGLWLLQHWAEWLTVIITGSLVPLEIYEIVRHTTAMKMLVLAINVAIVVYLLLRIRGRSLDARERSR
ncbi:MAG TPA: DUF2127 domain-containing protein [Acidobacteriaceae bacterium]